MKKIAYFLAKSDPDDYGLDELERDGQTTWDGVKNPQALAALRTMRQGDCVLVYHSGGISAIVGWAYAASDPRPDPQQEKLSVIDLRFGGRLAEPVPLSRIKAEPGFADFALVRQGRLSTMAVPAAFIQWLKKTSPDFRP